MCNLYSINKTREEIRQLVKALHDLNNNQPPLPAGNDPLLQNLGANRANIGPAVARPHRDAHYFESAEMSCVRCVPFARFAPPRNGTASRFGINSEPGGRILADAKVAGSD